MATAVIPQREIIRFEPGQPETVCLKYASGKEVNGRGGPQFMFTTIDDRIFFIDPDVAYGIEKCGVPAGQPITITKTKGPRNAVNWDVRAAGSADARRSAAPAPAASACGDSDLTEQLQQSIERAKAARGIPAQTGAAAPVRQEVTRAQAKLLAALCVAIDSCVEAKAYAQRRGLPLEFTGEDVRAMASTLMISADRAAQNGGAR